LDDVEAKSSAVGIPVPDIERNHDETEETDKEPERRSSYAQLLPVEKARKRIRSKHSESEHDQNYLPVLDEVSLYTTPSMFSLVSIPDDITAEKKEKV